MNKLILSIFLIFISFNGYGLSLTNSLVFSSKTEVITDGLNPVTYEPLPSSDWVVKFSTANKGSCEAFNSTGEIYNDGLIFKTKVSYKDKTSLDCTGLTLEDDPHNIVAWIDQGIVQESFFPDEVLNCGVGAVCDANQTVTYENKNFATINPTAGGNATSSGKTDIFLYNYKTISSASTNGSFGFGGLANLPKNPLSTKYCLYLRDATTDTRTSSYAKNPEVSLKVYNWRPINQGPSAPNGAGIGTIQRSTIIKGLDSSIRYWLGRGSVLGE